MTEVVNTISGKLNSILMVIMTALLLWFGNIFLELKVQVSRIESDTVHIRINQEAIREDVKILAERVRLLEINKQTIL